jgi:hypothetical protein
VKRWPVTVLVSCAAAAVLIMPVSASTATVPAEDPAGFVLVAGSVQVTTQFGDYSIDVLVVRGFDGRVAGFYSHSDSHGNYTLVEAQCVRLSPGRAVIAGIVRQTSLANRIGTWAALTIDDRGNRRTGIRDRVISGVQGPDEGPFCPIPFSPAQIAGPWDEITSGDVRILRGWSPS